MNPGGVVLIVLSLWVGTQVLGGQALERLGVLDASGRSTGTGSSSTTSGSSSTPTKTPEQAAASGYVTPPAARLNIPSPV